MIRINALTLAKILRMLWDGPQTIGDMIEETGMHDCTIRNHLKALRRENLVYVCGWRMDSRGVPQVAVYRLTPDHYDVDRPHAKPDPRRIKRIADRVAA